MVLPLPMIMITWNGMSEPQGFDFTLRAFVLFQSDLHHLYFLGQPAFVHYADEWNKLSRTKMSDLLFSPFSENLRVFDLLYLIDNVGIMMQILWCET